MVQPDTLPKTSNADRLDMLRTELGRLDLSGFVIAHTDEHKSEFTPDRARRLTWLTGFTGSAGLAIVLTNSAAIFVDGRYVLQVRAQVDGEAYDYLHMMETPPLDWLVSSAQAGDRIGYDPWLHDINWTTILKKALNAKGAELVAVNKNPIDVIWDGQPEPSTRPAVPHTIEFSGESSLVKRQKLAEQIRQARAHAAVFTALDSIAWLFNIRGTDVEHTPLVIAFAILNEDATADLFINPSKITDVVKSHLGDQVRLHSKSDFDNGLRLLGEAKKRILVDPNSASTAVFDLLERAGAIILPHVDICQLPKAIKNQTEINGARAAHIRDGAALTRFLAWMSVHGPSGDLDEVTAADQLEIFRHETGQLKDRSFPSISGAGPNGAIMHYKVRAETARKIEPGMLYLIDSGGQYLDGTTDVTRTIAIGMPGPEEKDRFTRVLKGHIAIATARFPTGTSGTQLDTLARLSLWRAGLNYDHGTGHGVGSYLNVHEGPQGITKNYVTAPLQPGMIISNEPGYYKPGAYGIRIENLVVVRKADNVQGDIPVCEFETLTLAPIDINLIAHELLTDDEVGWLNNYHARVLEIISPLVDSVTAKWLAQVTAPI